MKLIDSSGTELFVRAKRINYLREAMVYEDIENNNLAIKDFIPKYIGTCDSSFNPLINLDEQENQNEEFYWLLLEDVVLNLPCQEKGEHGLEVCDFKFAAEPLCGNDDEKKLHKQNNLHSSIYKFFQKIFFSLSDCPFVYQKCCKTTGRFHEKDLTPSTFSKYSSSQPAI